MALNLKLAAQKYLGCVRNNCFPLLTALGIASGISLGFFLRHNYGRPKNEREVVYVKFVGDLFIGILRALILPLIVSSLITTISSLDTGASGRIGRRAITCYVITTICAVTTGIVSVMTIHPGMKDNRSDMEDAKQSKDLNPIDSLLDIVRNLFPPNIVQATMFVQRTKLITPKLSEEDLYLNKSLPPINEWPMELKYEEGTNIMGLLVFSVAMGVCLGQMGEAGKPLADFAKSLSQTMMKITRVFMWKAPIGVCFLIAAQLWSATSIPELLINFGWFFLTVIIGLFTHGFIVLPLMYAIVTRTLPFRYIANMTQAIFTAFGTASSLVTLPVTIECLEKKNGVDPRVSRFVLPVGASMNLDGTALYEAVAVIFLAQVAGVTLTLGNIVALSITVTAAPQAGILTITMVLTSIGVSPDYIAYILPLDWLLFRTTINVLGDCYVAGIVNHLSKDEFLTAEAAQEDLQGSPRKPNK